MKIPSISIVTTCKWRLHHLRETLHSMLAQDFAGDWEVKEASLLCDSVSSWSTHPVPLLRD